MVATWVIRKEKKEKKKGKNNPRIDFPEFGPDLSNGSSATLGTHRHGLR